MAYSKLHFNLLSILNNYLNWKEQTVIEFGSQDVNVGIIFLLNFIRAHSGIKIKNFDKYFNKDKNKISSRIIYENLGVKKYDTIDINGEYNSLKYDLNYNLKEKYNFNSKYSIVTNFGTTEHIFNQQNCFENLHNLCKVDGLIIINLPISGYSNHGFFNYHPIFFEHIAKENKYEILYRKYFTFSYNEEEDSKNILIVFKKIFDNKFKVPLQKFIDIFPPEINLLEISYIKKQFEILTGIDMNKIKNIAIFGGEEAGKEAFEFCKSINKNIICFIDDFKSGSMYDIPIVSYEDFIKHYQKKVDLILIGNYQRGDIMNRKNLNVKVIMLSNLIKSI